ncbi:hypothetical protein D9M71_150320 [compost metagenome]
MAGPAIWMALAEPRNRPTPMQAPRAMRRMCRSLRSRERSLDDMNTTSILFLGCQQRTHTCRRDRENAKAPPPRQGTELEFVWDSMTAHRKRLPALVERAWASQE